MNLTAPPGTKPREGYRPASIPAASTRRHRLGSHIAGRGVLAPSPVIFAALDVAVLALVVVGLRYGL